MKEDLEFLATATYVANYGTCKSRKVGGVLVKDNEILCVGFAGAPDNYHVCETCYRRDNNFPSGTMLDKCYSIHAEQRIIFCALKKGIDLSECTMYINCTPCMTCAKFLVHMGIKKVITSSYYPDDFSIDFMKKANLNLEVIEEELPTIKEDYKIRIEELLKEKN